MQRRASSWILGTRCTGTGVKFVCTKETRQTHVSGFIAQLVSASDRYREVTGSNPIEVLNFSGFFMQLQKLRS